LDLIIIDGSGGFPLSRRLQGNVPSRLIAGHVVNYHDVPGSLESATIFVSVSRRLRDADIGADA